MKNNNWLLLLIGVTIVGALFFTQPDNNYLPITRKITVIADQFSFDASIIKVNHGDKIVITLQSMDVAHGFYLDGYEIQQEFVPGISEVFEFTADKKGKFRFRCSTVCGELHPFMIGEFIVQPNSPFQLAVKISVAVLLLTLLYFRFSTNYQEDQIKVSNNYEI